MHALHERMVSWSTPQRAVVAYAAAVAALLAYLSYVARLDALIGWGGKLDLRPGGYDRADVDALFAELGDEGRSLYIRTTIGDSIWPMLAGISAVVAAPLAAGRRRTVLALGLAPLAFGVVDVVENVGVLTLLARHPDVSDGTVALASAVTRLKLAILPAAFVAWFAVPVLAVRRHRLSAGGLVQAARS